MCRIIPLRPAIRAFPDAVITSADGITVEFRQSLLSVLAAEAEAEAGASFPRIVSKDSAGSAHCDGFPGFVVRDNTGLLAAVGCLPEPDGTLSITVPIVRPGLEHRQLVRGVGFLFEQVRRYARDQDNNDVHCLVDPETSERLKASDSPAAEELLTAGGMQRIADLQRVTRLVDPVATARRSEVRDRVILPAGQVLSVSIRSAIADELHCGSPSERADLCEFVGRVLKDSDDLPSFIRPTAERLLTSWEERRADVLAVMDQDVSKQDARQNYVAIAACTWSADEGCLMIEYLGVCPQYRRSGIGQWLLQRLENHARNLSGKLTVVERSSAEVAAFVDVANFAATRLYESAGYVADGDYQLWHMPLSGVPE